MIPFEDLPIGLLQEFEQRFRLIELETNEDGTKTQSIGQVPEIVWNNGMIHDGSKWESKWSRKLVDTLLTCDLRHVSPRDYPNAAAQFQHAFDNIISVKGLTVLVVGSISPWLECLCLRNGAAHIICMDCNKRYCEHPCIDTVTSLQDIQADVAISFATVNHSGLGRYGDAIHPDGDIRLLQNIAKTLQEGGRLLLGVPVGQDSIICGNLYRLYNEYGIKQLLDRSGFVMETVIPWPYHPQNTVVNWTGSSIQNQPLYACVRLPS
jgi:hypothetical protein